MATTLNPLLIPGGVIQVVTASLSALITTNVAMPVTTLWTQSHGVQILTATITPKSATSILLIDSAVHGLSAFEAYIFTALFRDSGNVIAYGQCYDPVYTADMICFSHSVVAGSVSPTTFKIRGGMHGASTTYFGNAQGPASLPPSFLRVMEISA